MEGYTIFGALSLLTFILSAASSPVFLPAHFPGIQSCTSNPCQNGGTCNQLTYREHTCSCTAEFMGSNCEKEVGVNMQTHYMIRYEFNQTQGLSAPNITYVRVGFMTRKKQGILLQMNNGNGEYVSLELNNSGHTHFDVDLTNGQPHEVIMRREHPSDILLQVDNYRPVHGQLSWRMTEPTIIDEPKFLYIGNTDTWSTWKGFEGCIYGVQVDDFYPLKLAFQDPRPPYIVATPSDHILDEVCAE